MGLRVLEQRRQIRAAATLAVVLPCRVCKPCAGARSQSPAVWLAMRKLLCKEWSSGELTLDHDIVEQIFESSVQQPAPHPLERGCIPTMAFRRFLSEVSLDFQYSDLTPDFQRPFQRHQRLALLDPDASMMLKVATETYLAGMLREASERAAGDRISAEHLAACRQARGGPANEWPSRTTE